MRRCLACKHFLPMADAHNLCISCRGCSEDCPCDLDRDWTPEQWADLKAKRLERSSKKALPQQAPAALTVTPDWQEFFQTALNSAMAPINSRLAALEDNRRPSVSRSPSPSSSTGYGAPSRDSTGHSRVHTDHDPPSGGYARPDSPASIQGNRRDPHGSPDRYDGSPRELSDYDTDSRSGPTEHRTSRRDGATERRSRGGPPAAVTGAMTAGNLVRAATEAEITVSDGKPWSIPYLGTHLGTVTDRSHTDPLAVNSQRRVHLAV